MSDLRKAAEAALEALEGFVYHGIGPNSGPALASLRAALAQPEPEPVAWIQPDHLQKARQAPFLCRVEPTQRMVDFVPLYTAPPQRKPLTGAGIYALFQKAGLEAYHQRDSVVQYDYDKRIEEFARAIESAVLKAHGIGGEK